MTSQYATAFLWSLLLVGTAAARVWRVAPDGTGDAPTIQAGSDSATAGDTVLVGCGVHYESQIWLKAGITLLGESERGTCAVIDAQEAHYAITCSGSQAETVIEGLTIEHGLPPDWPIPSYGGGVNCGGHMTIRRCVFVDNEASFGGALFLGGGHATIESCTFIANRAGQGSAVCCSTPSATITNCAFTDNESDKGTVALAAGAQSIMGCTFCGNSALTGGSGVYCLDTSSPSIEQSVFANGVQGQPVSCGYFSYPVLSCCDIFGNAGGDWVGCIASQNGSRGNFSADPRFCGASGGNLTVEECSPCLPGHHPNGYICGGVIGAFGSYCACSSAIEQTTWGTIKARYR